MYNHDPENGSDRSSWTHPDPNYREKYIAVEITTDKIHKARPHYDALSYTWDISTTSDLVLLEDHKGGDPTTLILGMNLVTAFRYLRSV